MRGLKIQGRWLQLVLSGHKTMEVRTLHFKLKGTGKALGNSNTGNVEGYATVQDVIDIPFSDIGKYEGQHRATQWLIPYSREEISTGTFLLMLRESLTLFHTPKPPAFASTLQVRRHACARRGPITFTQGESLA